MGSLEPKTYLSFAMKRAFHGDGWKLPSRFINEIPEDSIQKNEIGGVESEDFEFNQDNSIEFEEGYRSPVGIDIKNKILNGKNKKN